MQIWRAIQAGTWTEVHDWSMMIMMLLALTCQLLVNLASVSLSVSVYLSLVMTHVTLALLLLLLHFAADASHPSGFSMEFLLIKNLVPIG